MVLTYDDFYSRMAQLPDLIALLQRFAVDDWLCQLARLSILLAGENSRSARWANAFLQNFTPHDLVDKVNAWFEQFKKRGVTATVPSERDVGILIELAVLHAPATAPRRMGFPQDARAVFDALLMTCSLAQPKLEGMSHKEMVSVFASLWLRSICPDPLTVMAHGYHLFEILASRRSSEAAEWATIFEQATGQPLDDYFAGGFAIAVQLLAQSPEDIGRCWTSVLDPAHLDKFPKFKQPVSAYCHLRRTRLAQLKEAVAECEEHQDDLGSFNLIAIRKTPLIDYQGTVYPLYLHGIASSLLDGIYHAAILPGAENTNQRKRVGGVFGKMHETDVLNVLEKGVADRLLRSPTRTDTGEEAADGIVLCEGGLLVLQIKGYHTPAQSKFQTYTPQTLQQFFERIGLAAAVSQLVRTLQACRQGLVEGLPQHWTEPDTPIQPVILTFERVPQFSLLASEIDSLIEKCRIDSYVRKPILLSREDVERIAILPGGQTLWGLLREYSSSVGGRAPFHNFLNDKKVGGGELHVIRQQEMIRRIAEHFGYDLGLDEPADGP